MGIHVEPRCYCGSGLSHLIVKDGGTRVCTDAGHRVVPCMTATACKGNVFVPGFEPMMTIREKGAHVAPFYVCDACLNMSASSAGDSTRRTAIDAAFEMEQACDLCGMREKDHGGMMHPHVTSVKRRHVA